MSKKRVLFVGSFKNSTKDGGVGGQMYASKTILESKISEKIEWILVDSTADSNVNSSIFNRTLKAVLRLSKCLFHIIFSKPEYVFVFTGGGASFIEKGVIILIAHSFCKKTVMAPRAGNLKEAMENNVHFKKFAIWVFRKSDFVICQSNFWKKNYEVLLPINQRDKFIVINNAINIALYPKVDVLKSKENKINILFLGWVIKEKGIYELIEAAKLVVAKEKNTRFIIAGKGEDFDNALEMVKENGLTDFFDFKGWVVKEKKSALIQDTHIFVTPTHNEGLSNSLIEAMASGLPCIASNVTSMPDIVINNKIGILFDLHDVQQLSDAILNLIADTNLRETIGNNARNHIKDNFSVENLFKELNMIFFP
jgi:glycosyltransferase involved in cell wall biosynthesis